MLRKQGKSIAWYSKEVLKVNQRIFRMSIWVLLGDISETETEKQHDFRAQKLVMNIMESGMASIVLNLFLAKIRIKGKWQKV